MNQQSFPIKFSFRIGSIKSSLLITDANEAVIAFAQKFGHTSEGIGVYSDTSREDVLYYINPDSSSESSESYLLQKLSKEVIGSIARKDGASTKSFELFDQNNELLYTIFLENKMIKGLDNVFGSMPVVGSYFFNPSYAVHSTDDVMVARLRKEPSLFGRNFIIFDKENLQPQQGELLVLGLLTVVISEHP